MSHFCNMKQKFVYICFSFNQTESNQNFKHNRFLVHSRTVIAKFILDISDLELVVATSVLNILGSHVICT